jgi:hypothetical protein
MIANLTIPTASRRLLASCALLAVAATTALAQQTAGTSGSPGATTTIDGKQLPPPDPKFGGTIKDDALQSKPWWPPRVVPPKGAPNVLLIITDDAGFGVPSTFGGVIPTPTMDRIANEGLRYNRVFSTALCSPTRACLITGRNHHSAGFGVVSEQSTGFPGYNSIIGKDKATIGRILLDNGYATSWFGKEHNTPAFAAALSRNDSLQAKLDKLDAMLAQSSTSTQDAALLAEMLSLPNDGRYSALELTPQQRRQRTFEALVSQIVALSRQNPLLMIFEDAHWTDPTTLELFGRIVDRISNRRVLLIVTFRPEFEPPWIGRPYVTPLTINRLPEREVGAMIDGFIGNKLLAANIRQDIIERTDGIPLFVEEITRAVLEAKDEEAAERRVGAVPSPSIAVPPSLHASLMARLDRLGAAKEVVQIGSAIGREFTHALLAAVVRKPEQELGPALVGESRIPRDDKKPSDAREAGDDIIDHAIAEIVLLMF